MINEPGKGEHWAKVGDNIGNFVLERIEPGTIIYRYGSSFDHILDSEARTRREALDRQVSEMAVEIDQPVRIVRERALVREKVYSPFIEAFSVLCSQAIHQQVVFDYLIFHS